MSYYRAPALDKLVAEVNERWPGRDKASDGWIGDASHSARASDHNPDYSDGGIVRAQDIDNDGIDREWLVQWLINDPRVKYVITMGRIWQSPDVYQNGGWQRYTGTSPHNHHVHVSVRPGSYQVDTRPWFVDNGMDWLDMATREELAEMLAQSEARIIEAVKQSQRIFFRDKKGRIAMITGTGARNLTGSEWQHWSKGLGYKLDQDGIDPDSLTAIINSAGGVI